MTIKHAPLNEFPINFGDRKLQLRLRSDTSTNLVLKEVFGKKVYAPLQTTEVRRAILDIGANQGITSAYFRLVFPKAKIVAVEPDPASFPILLENATRLGNSTAHNLALLDRNGKAHFKSSKISVVSTLYDLPHPGIENDIVEVDLRHAGQFADEAAAQIGTEGFDMLKVDTEGAEVPILQALGERLVNIQTIFLEFHSLQDRRAIEAMLTPSHDIQREMWDTPERGSLAFLKRHR